MLEQLFKYVVYIVRGNLDYYDPATDMLVDSNVYLTWRRFNDEVPNGGRIYGFAFRDNQLGSWLVLRSNHRVFFQEVEEWLEYQKGDKPSLGSHQPSEFKCCLRASSPVPGTAMGPWFDYQLPIVRKFWKTHWGIWSPILQEELDELQTAFEKWHYLRDKTIEILLDEGVVPFQH